MPIVINEMSSTVQVDEGAAPAGEHATGGTEPAPLEQQRWQALARRSEQLDARVAAWDFDD